MTGPATGPGDGTDDASTTPEQPAPGPADHGAARRPSPTSRARRIGGISRPTGGRATGAPAHPEDDAPPTTPGAPAVALGKAPAVPAAEPAEADSADTQPAETASTETASTEPAPSRATVEIPAWLRWLPAAALGAAALIMLVFFLISAHGVWWGRPSANAVRDQVLSAAKSCMVATNSWNYKTLAADEAKGAQCTTGTRTTQYRNGMEKVVKKYAAKLQASQVAQVSTAGVSGVSSDGRSWTVLVVGQLDIRQKSDPKGRTDPFAALVRMDKVGDRWLMSQLQEVSGPSS